MTPPDAAGRHCPLHYRYPPAVFAAPAALEADTLYVVGGLYGNDAAWDAVLRLFEAEPACSKQLVLNGDFHWFDAEPALFGRIEAATRPHHRLRGNVETELALPTEGAGCGCAYPDTVDDGTVERSNRILARLRQAALQVPGACSALAALPMQATAQVGPLRVGLVHGDAESLAGWGFDAIALDDPAHHARLARWFAEAEVDAFACSHTCAAALRRFALPGGDRVVLNNGAAGMPCVAGRRHGVLSRIATTPAPAGLQRLYGTVLHGVHLDAIAVPYDAEAWDRRFLALWPPGSDAHRSYWPRLQHGPAGGLPAAA